MIETDSSYLYNRKQTNKQTNKKPLTQNSLRERARCNIKLCIIYSDRIQFKIIIHENEQEM